MDLLQLQYFRTIAQYENMTKAAEALFVSQPNLSTSLSRLEADLGVRLFERRRGKISLTANGQMFLDYVDRALDELDVGVERLRSETNAADNCIRVAGTMSDLLSRVLLQYYYPDQKDVRIKQVNCSNADVYDRVLSEVVDIGFFFGEPVSDALEYHRIIQSERVAIVRRDHPLAAHGLISLSQLSGERFICNHCRDDDRLMEELPRWSGFSPHVFFDCDDALMEATLAAAGKGVSLAPAPTFYKLVQDDPTLPITYLRFAEPLPPAQMGLVRRRGHRLTQAALDFYQYVTRFLQDETAAVSQAMGERL